MKSSISIVQLIQSKAHSPIKSGYCGATEVVPSRVSHLREAISMEKRYFTSDRSNLS